MDHYRVQTLCRVAECNTQQRALGSDFVGKDVFAECLLSGTRCFAECPGRHSAKERSRDGVWGRDGVFAECP
jgi:hypothetical protein